MKKRIKNPCAVRDAIIQWIRSYMGDNGESTTPIVIGISGGKDSSVVAALCVEAVGKDRVIGVLMPNGNQKDIDVSRALVEYLGIKSYEINIYDTLMAMRDQIYRTHELRPNDISEFNTPARIRMAVLYDIANIVDGRVANTCNYTESYLGYDTKFGDQCGDFAPISDILCTDVIRIGRTCGLPQMFTEKVPEDGLCGKSDEERFGFSYIMADDFLEEKLVPADITAKIIKMHEASLHKTYCVNIPHYRNFTENDLLNTCCCSLQ